MPMSAGERQMISSIFDEMLANYRSAQSQYVDAHKSQHWDVFPGDYEDVIRDAGKWPEFRNNGISDYLDTTIAESKTFQSSEIKQAAAIAALRARYDSLAGITGRDFI